MTGLGGKIASKKSATTGMCGASKKAAMAGSGREPKGGSGVSGRRAPLSLSRVPMGGGFGIQQQLLKPDNWCNSSCCGCGIHQQQQQLVHYSTMQPRLKRPTLQTRPTLCVPRGHHSQRHWQRHWPLTTRTLRPQLRAQTLQRSERPERKRTRNRARTPRPRPRSRPRMVTAFGWASHRAMQKMLPLLLRSFFQDDTEQSCPPRGD